MAKAVPESSEDCFARALSEGVCEIELPADADKLSNTECDGLLVPCPDLLSLTDADIDGTPDADRLAIAEHEGVTAPLVGRAVCEALPRLVSVDDGRGESESVRELRDEVLSRAVEDAVEYAVAAALFRAE